MFARNLEVFRDIIRNLEIHELEELRTSWNAERFTLSKYKLPFLGNTFLTALGILVVFFAIYEIL